VFENRVLRRIFAPKRDHSRRMDEVSQRGASYFGLIPKYY
jgi:hypothetical protein